MDFEPTRSSRRGSSSRRNQQNENDDLDDILESFSASTKPQAMPRKLKKEDSEEELQQAPADDTEDPPIAVSGWTESAGNRTGRRRDAGASIEFSSDLFSVPKKVDGVNQREFNKYEEPTDIPEIPDLDDNENDNSEDMAFQVAEAPDVQVHQISTYKELDKEFFREKAFQFLEGNIDVSLLHCGLNTETQIAEEEDTIWEWTKLFTEVVSVLSHEKERDDKDDKDLLFSDDQKAAAKKSDIFGGSDTGKRVRNIEFGF